MRMADVAAVFGTLLGMGIAFPGLLTAVWLAFPAAVERGRNRVELTPWRCFWLGLLMTGFIGLPALGLLQVPGPGQFTGATLLIATLGMATIGAAGMAAQLSVRLAAASNGRLSTTAAFVIAAVVLELAAAFPVIGWFLLLPVMIVLGLGATTFALLRWRPPTLAQANRLTLVEQAA